MNRNSPGAKGLVVELRLLPTTYVICLLFLVRRSLCWFVSSRSKSLYYISKKERSSATETQTKQGSLQLDSGQRKLVVGRLAVLYTFVRSDVEPLVSSVLSALSWPWGNFFGKWFPTGYGYQPFVSEPTKSQHRDSWKERQPRYCDAVVLYV
ncbi:hypothetical protein VTK73DRAFT_9165 [Phialemonium thermophilum]|uniref:Uncharacterized protein n=1 Tax=Phialemonium thermophilum TaxID=223376 RepID=A0ABR3W481_9PEZI